MNSFYTKTLQIRYSMGNSFVVTKIFKPLNAVYTGTVHFPASTKLADTVEFLSLEDKVLSVVMPLYNCVAMSDWLP